MYTWRLEIVLRRDSKFMAVTYDTASQMKEKNKKEYNYLPTHLLDKMKD